MRFKLFKTVSNVFVSSLVVLVQHGENLKYTKIAYNALLPYMGLYKWIGWSNDRDWTCVWKLRHHTYRSEKIQSRKNSSRRTRRREKWISLKIILILQYFLLFTTRSSSGWVLMLLNFLWSKSMVSELSNALSITFIRLSKPLVQSHIWQ